jgi:hypothetical protein
MTKRLRVSAINESSSDQVCSNDQLRVEKFAYYGSHTALQVTKIQLKEC